MSEEKRDKPTYIMVPRKMIVTWIATTTVLIVINISLFQYANYIERKDNSLLCGIVILFDNTYKQNPPAPGRGQVLAQEFHRIRTGYNCK